MTISEQMTLAAIFTFYYLLPYCKRSMTLKRSNIDLIKKAINESGWDETFSNTTIDKKVTVFNKTIHNILHNFVRLEHFYL